MDNKDLFKKYPWLRHIMPYFDNISKVLFEKELQYAGSWQKRGGVGAYMMMARKWDRIEEISKRHGYDIFEAGSQNDSDVLDDIDDLVAYLALIRAQVTILRTPENVTKGD